MRTLAAPLLASLALAACGDTLVDHTATDVQQGPGNLVCAGDTPVSCRIGGDDACKPEGLQYCGATQCRDCRGTFAPAGGAAACLNEGTGLGFCGYECLGGLLKCTEGCCKAASLAAGARHTCAVTQGGGLFCWGDNAEGQVSGTASAAVTAPLKRFDLGVVAVAAGDAHTCAALSSEVRCFGRDVEGQATPPGDLPAGVTALAAGATHTCALVGATGAVRCWGAGDAVGGGAPILAGATAIAAGAAHTCALDASGVKCWGANTDGQLGDGSTTSSPAPPLLPVLTGIAAITARGNHTCAASGSSNGQNVDDALRCWGDGLSELGLAPQQTSPAIPLKDPGHSVVRFAVDRLAAGGAHFCVQKGGDQVLCFGPPSLFASGGAGQLGGTPAGDGEVVPVPGTPAAKAFAAGVDHGCAVFSDDTVHCWGKNDQGQLGDGTTVTPGDAPDPRILGTPVPVSGR